MVDAGKNQHGTIDKEDAATPTAALESVLLTSIIDAAEEMVVAVIDIPNAFIQTRIKNDDNKVVLRLRRKLANILIKTAPEIYRKHITNNRKGETVLYVRALNVIYGIMKNALLVYQKLMTIGFEMKLYDLCIANKTINGKQLTLIWHVDDIKASHVESEVVICMEKWLRKTYKRLFKDVYGKMKLCRVKNQDYLGMNLDYTVIGEVKITMIPYIKEMIRDFREQDTSSGKKGNTPAGEFLFNVDDE